MRRNNASLHLLDRLKRLAAQEETSVNQLVTLAVAEKLARLDAEAFYRAREGRSDRPDWRGDAVIVLPRARGALGGAGAGWRALVERMGRDAQPMEGDELPPEEGEMLDSNTRP